MWNNKIKTCIVWFLISMVNNKITGESSFPISNLWIRLAKIAGSSNICLQQDAHIGTILSSCLLPVCYPAEKLKNYTFFAQFPNKTVTYSDSYNWGTPTYKLPKNAIRLYTPRVSVSANDTCAEVKNCSSRCTQLGNNLACNILSLFPMV